MPLYQLCDKIILDKIAEKNYVSYLRRISRKTWDTVISDDVITEILQISQRHPRRTYNLCLYVWRLADIYNRMPNVEAVNAAWQKLMRAEIKSVRYHLSKKNTSQLKVLVYIAMNNVSTLTGKAAQQTLDLSATAISKALRLLEEADLIERDDGNSYQIIDPIIKSVLTEYEKDLIT